MSQRCSDGIRSPLYEGNVNKMSKEQVKSWVLSDVLLEVMECSQMLERNFSNDEWLVSNVAIYPKDFDFTVFNKNGTRYNTKKLSKYY